MELPHDLRRWEAQLGIFPRDVALGLGKMLARLEMALGPMRAPAVTGAGEPDGFDGIARRGDYERLLMTEWLLAEEAPEEFVRRTAMGEHVFLSRARREPARARRCVVLFDGGPDQLGGPRVVHVAALCVLARRASDANAQLSWGRLGAENPTLLEGLTREAVQSLLQMRGAQPATHEAVREAAPHVNDGELWIVGGASLRDAAASVRAAHLEIEQVLEPGVRQVRVTARPPDGAPRACVLELPPPDACARLLRDPFQIAVAPSARAGVAFAPHGGIVLSADGRRVFALGADGSLLTVPIPSSARASAPRVARFRPPEGHTVVAVGYARAAKRVIVVTEKTQYRHYAAHVLSRRGDQSTRTVEHGSEGSVAQTSLRAAPVAPAHRAPEGTLYFADGYRLLRLAPEGPPVVVSRQVAAFAPGRMRFLCVARVVAADGALQQMDLRASENESAPPLATVRVDDDGERGPWRAFVGAVEPVALAAVQARAHDWIVVRGSETLNVRLAPELTVFGVLETGWSPPRPALVCVNGARTHVVLAREGKTEPLFEVPSRIAHLAVSGSDRVITYLSESGELGVYHLATSGVVLRVKGDA